LGVAEKWGWEWGQLGRIGARDARDALGAVRWDGGSVRGGMGPAMRWDGGSVRGGGWGGAGIGPVLARNANFDAIGRKPSNDMRRFSRILRNSSSAFFVDI
jgi:hypothetical protein